MLKSLHQGMRAEVRIKSSLFDCLDDEWASTGLYIAPTLFLVLPNSGDVRRM